MKKSILFFGMTMTVLMFTGCMKKAYQDVTSKEYATFQMTTKGKPFYWNDDYTVFIYDYSNGCKNMPELGLIYTYGEGPTDIAKLPVDAPLLFKVRYNTNKGAGQNIDYTNFVLTPENNKHYVVEYSKKENDGRLHTEYNVYIQKGEESIPIPDSKIREFHNRECM